MPKSLKPTITSNWMNLSVKVVIVCISTCFFFFNGTQISKADEATISIAHRLIDEGNFKAAHTELFQINYLNNPEALNLLAQIYSEEEFGIDANKIEFYLARASELGHTESMVDLGVYYEDGDILPKNLDLTMQLYERAHRLGDSQATYYLALNYQFGIGVEQDIETAIGYYEEAVRRENEDATIDLGYLYVNGEFIEVDYKKAYKIFLPLAKDGVVDAQYNLALIYQELGQLDRASEWFLKAHNQEFAPASYALGELYYYEFETNDVNLQKAIKYFNQAAKTEDSNVLYNLALIYSDFEKPLFNKDKARHFFEEAHNLGDFDAALNLARSYNYYTNYSDYNEAFGLSLNEIASNLLKAQEWYRRAIDNENFLGVYEFALTYEASGDIETAKNIILEAIKFAETTNPPDIVMKTHMYSFLSDYYETLGFEEEALRIMSLAVSTIKENDSLFPPLAKSMTYRDFAGLLSINGDHQEALRFYNISETIEREEKELELLALTLNGKAIVLEQLERYEEAVDAYYEAISYIEDTIGPTVDADRAMIFGNLVRSLIKLDRLDDALSFSQKSVEMIGALSRGHQWHIRVTSELAEVYERLGQSDKAKLAHNTAAELFTQRYFSLSPSDLTSLRIGEYYSNIYPIARASNYYIRDYLETENKNSLGSAFINFQKSNFSSAEFEMARLTNRLQWQGNSSRSYLKEYQILTDEISNINFDITAKLADKNFNKSEIETLESNLSALMGRRGELSNKIFSQQDINTSYANRFLTIEEVQRLLKPSEVLIYPAMTFLDTPITTIIITKDTATASTSDLTAEEIRDKSDTLRKSLQFKSADELSIIPAFDIELSIELFDILVGTNQSILRKKSDIIFIPTWPISNLPLSVLIMENSPKKFINYSNYKWLGLEKNISYITSIGDFQQSEVDQRDLELSSFLGIGDPLLGPSTQSLRGLNFVDQTKSELEKTYNLKSLPSLPSTGLEIKSVQEIFPKAQTNIFLGSEATERNLKYIDTSKFNVISFATHGLMANEWKNLDEPALVLTPTPNDSDYDGLLTASEIRELDFNADLIVLSACNTAAGDGESDEGLSGLASAFIFAGAKSVMASHWSIESNTTKNLMTDFFKNLKSNQALNRAEALRLAMQKTASQEQFSHPIFWAPFVLVGQR